MPCVNYVKKHFFSTFGSATKLNASGQIKVTVHMEAVLKQLRTVLDDSGWSSLFSVLVFDHWSSSSPIVSFPLRVFAFSIARWIHLTAGWSWRRYSAQRWTAWATSKHFGIRCDFLWSWSDQDKERRHACLGRFVWIGVAHKCSGKFSTKRLLPFLPIQISLRVCTSGQLKRDWIWQIKCAHN